MYLYCNTSDSDSIFETHSLWIPYIFPGIRSAVIAAFFMLLILLTRDVYFSLSSTHASDERIGPCAGERE